MVSLAALRDVSYNKLRAGRLTDYLTAGCEKVKVEWFEGYVVELRVEGDYKSVVAGLPDQSV